MQTGKLTETALKRSVLRQIHTDSVMCHYGEDCVMQTGSNGGTKAYVTAGAVPGSDRDPGRILIAAANNLAAAGAVIDGFLVQATLPESMEESGLREAMIKLREAAARTGASILGGDTRIQSGIADAVYSVTGIGSVPGKHAGQTKRLQPGMDLVVTRWIGLAGTAALAERYQEMLLKRFPHTLVDDARAFEQMSLVGEEGNIIAGFDGAVSRDLSHGGIFNALWEMAERAGVGLEVDLKKIPVRQETIEICEYFDINPYYFYSAGALLAGVPDGEALVGALKQAQIPSTVIGRVHAGNDRKIQNGQESRFLDRPKQDEWYRRTGEMREWQA